jgi:rod shape-determining protein MreD
MVSSSKHGSGSGGVLSIARVFWMVMPALLTLLIMVIPHIPGPLPYLKSIAPLVGLIAIYFWTLFDDAVMPYWLIFVLGLIHDSLTGMPVGLSSFIYLMLYTVLGWQRERLAHEHFLINWLLFLLISAACQALTWALLSAVEQRMLVPVEFLLQWLVTICFYPCIHLIFSRIYIHLHHGQRMRRHAS